MISIYRAVGWFTPLHLALGNGWTETAMMLYGGGADPHALNKVGETPIDYGKQRGFVDASSEFFDFARREEIVKRNQARATKQACLQPSFPWKNHADVTYGSNN